MAYSVVSKIQLPVIAGLPHSTVVIYQVLSDGATGNIDCSGEFKSGQIKKLVVLGSLGSTPAAAAVDGTTLTQVDFTSGTAGLISVLVAGG